MLLNRSLIPFAAIFVALTWITVPVQADDKSDKDAKAPAAEKAEKETKKKAADNGTAIAIKGTPTIDGEVDDIWKKAKAVKVAKPISALQVIDEKEMATASVRFLWDDKTLYALWRVNDPKISVVADNAWEHDSIEVFLDENKKATSYYEDDDAQYRVDAKGELSGQGEGYNVENVSAKTKVTKKGYLVEMAIKINQAELKSGAKLGLELQVNDNAGDATRGAVAKWHHTEDDSWESTSDFGTLLIK